MEIYYIITLFIFGTIFGSFFNVVGYRLPKEESIIFPPSHCPNCNYKLKALDLIPILSYFILRGKCRSCKKKISWFYPLFEFITGLLFSLSYIVFGYNIELLMALVFISSMIIVFISDYQTMIIPDEIIIFSTVALLILTFISSDLSNTIDAFLSGLIAFAAMFSLKLFGDSIFKKESMGGGDIKLLLVFGIYLGWELAIFSVFLASFIGLPISLIYLKLKKDNVIAFGPFLTISAVIITLLQIDIATIVNLLT
jgi:leader peptidase (prepilin peptidase) / N-methyltransferase